MMATDARELAQSRSSEVERDIVRVRGRSWPRLLAPAGEAVVAPRRRLTVFETDAVVS